MKRLLRSLKQSLIGLVIVAVLAVAVIYVMSARRMGRVYEAQGVAVQVPLDPTSIAEGQRLAILRGCYDGCHGDAYGGEDFIDEPFPMNLLLGHMVSPDLTTLAAEYDDAQLEQSIRHGVKQNGRSVLAMPSSMFAGLSDEDLSKILASIRSTDPSGGATGSTRLGPMARYFIINGGFQIEAEHIDHGLTPPERTPTESLQLGEYLARTVCTECHGLDLLGNVASGPIPAVPPLSVVVGYSRDQFDQLMRTGVPASGAQLDLMREVALGRFTRFTDREVAAIFSYLNRASTWERGGASSP